MFSLLHSTDFIIRVIQEVKSREEEYEWLKDLGQSIKGLPSGFQLAHRDRRLLFEGPLRRVLISEKKGKGKSVVTEKTRRRSNGSQATTAPPTPATLTDFSKLLPITNPQFELGSVKVPPTPPPAPVSDTVQHGVNAMRPESTVSEYSTTPSDYVSDWNCVYNGVIMPSGTTVGLRPDSVASSSSRSVAENSIPFIPHGDPISPRSRCRALINKRKSRPHENIVHVFVFSDCVLFTSPPAEKPLRAHKGSRLPCKLLDEIGLGKILSVSDVPGQHRKQCLRA
jgi:hypothetical protein